MLRKRKKGKKPFKPCFPIAQYFPEGAPMNMKDKYSYQ